MKTPNSDLFDEFMFDYDPTGEIRKWLTEEQLRAEFARWCESERKRRQSQSEASSQSDRQWAEDGEASHADTKSQTGRHKAKGASETIPFTVECFFCAKTLRLGYPLRGSCFRCPSCGGTYRVTVIDASTPVYVLLPTRGANRTNVGPTKRQMPEAVKQALELLDLGPSATLQHAKAAFRKAMAEYHPDRVAHLGRELRVLAERKTKEYIAAFRMIEAFFTSCGEA